MRARYSKPKREKKKVFKRCSLSFVLFSFSPAAATDDENTTLKLIIP